MIRGFFRVTFPIFTDKSGIEGRSFLMGNLPFYIAHLPRKNQKMDFVFPPQILMAAATLPNNALTREIPACPPEAVKYFPKSPPPGPSPIKGREIPSYSICLPSPVAGEGRVRDHIPISSHLPFSRGNGEFRENVFV
jgi:hypothetical protein